MSTLFAKLQSLSLLAILIAGLSARAVFAQPTADNDDPSASVSVSGAPTVPEIVPPGHGWMVLQDKARRTTAVLHLPPRGQTDTDGSGPTADKSGAARLAPGVDSSVEAIAWWNSRLYLLLDEERLRASSAADWQRRVLALTAVHIPGGGSSGGWQYPTGRPEFVAMLPGKAEVLSFGASRFGPIALIRPLRRPPAAAFEAVPRDASPAELLVHAGNRWHRSEPPWAVAASDASPGSRREDRAWILWPREGLLLAVHQSETPGLLWLWEADLPRLAPASEDGLQLQWSRRPVALPKRDGPATRADPWIPERVAMVNGHLIASFWAAEAAEAGQPGAAGQTGTLRLAWLREEGPLFFSRELDGVPRNFGFIPMDGGGRVCIVWPQVGETGAGTSAPGSVSARDQQIAEFSTSTGRMLFDGPLAVQFWFSMREYQTLVVVLVLVMAAVVVFVLRTEPATSAMLPAGVLMAEPGRRLLGAFLDYLPAALLVEGLFRLPPTALLIPSTGASQALWGVPLACGLAAVHCTLGEWLFGRSLGKLMTGTVVISSGLMTLQGRPPRPALWRVAIRNLIKWTVPVLGLLMFFDRGRRHPGDLAAGTRVVVLGDDAA